jgi:mono/diheme cytochrome c family protein
MHLRTILLAFALATPAFAQEPDAQAGRDIYLMQCWQCHGPDASGNGPMAEILAITTPDLTGLSTRNGGVFPLEAVARQIDGRDPLLAHGGEMPIYGPFLDADKSVALRLPSGQPMMTGLPLAHVIVYLQSIQTE